MDDLRPKRGRELCLRSSLPKKTVSRLKWTLIAAAVLGFVAVDAATLYEYGERSWRFRVDSSDNIDVTGMQNVTEAQSWR
jgi:hypothetical protein